MARSPNDGLEILVRVTPRSSRRRLEWVGDGTLQAWVHAAPAEGGANLAVAELLAESFGIPRTAVVLERGAASRAKRFRLHGLTWEQAHSRLPSPRLEEK